MCTLQTRNTSQSCHVELVCSETKGCDYDVASELLMAPSATSGDSDPYRRDPQLEVQRTGSGNEIRYRLLNTSRSAAPFLRIEIPRDVSVLRSFYEPTTVSDDQSLRAELTRQMTRSAWLLTVSGRLYRCPGIRLTNSRPTIGLHFHCGAWDLKETHLSTKVLCNRGHE